MEDNIMFFSESSYYGNNVSFIKSEPLDEDDIFLSEALSGVDRVVPEITEVPFVKSEPFWDSNAGCPSMSYSSEPGEYGRHSSFKEYELSDVGFNSFNAISNDTLTHEPDSETLFGDIDMLKGNTFSECGCAIVASCSIRHYDRSGFRKSASLSQDHSYSSFPGHDTLPSIDSVFERPPTSRGHLLRNEPRFKYSHQTEHAPYYSNFLNRTSSRNSKSTMTDVLTVGLSDVTPAKSDAGPVRKKREKKRGGTSPYTTVPLPPCKICSGSATGFHFGVITCEACKAFFRRALIHKQEYKCIKNDDCEIIDKKLGNCSACRLRKCFAVGMSKGGVRRGRYSIAIRTKAIVEAKAMAGQDAAPMLPRHETIEKTSDIPLYMSPPSSSGSPGSDSFDGLLEISDLDEELGLTVTLHPKPPSTFVYNSELESLIDALVSCQDAVYPNLKKQFSPQVAEFQLKLWEESLVKKEVFDDLFGESGSITTEEFQQIFAETGIDLDDRLQTFNQKGRNMEEGIAQFVNYAKIIPGFKYLNPKDVSRLLKASHMEFWLLGNYMTINNKLGVSGIPDTSCSISTKSQMYKFFDSKFVDELLEFADTLKTLSLSLEEIALLRAIVLTYTDRCTLADRGNVESLQNKYVECLQYYLEKNKPEPSRRLFQLFDRLLAVRDLSHDNMRVNRKFLSEWSFLMTEYPLWKEMLSFDEI